jgi:hypothetical protein
MNKLLTISIFLITSLYGFCQNSISADSIDKMLEEYYKKNTPELYRYGRLTIYGEIITKFSNEQIQKEKELFNLLKNSELINKPNDNVFALCHNLLIHSPEDGKNCLLLLNRPTNDENIIHNLFTEVFFSEEFGEQLAMDNVESQNIEWSKTWSEYLSTWAIFNSSIPRLKKMYEQTNDIEIKKNLINALMRIGNPNTIDFVQQIIETINYDEIQTKAIFAYAELAGYEGIKYLENVKTVGEKSKEEKKSSIYWLKEETSPKNKYGTEINNDINFIKRFADTKSPVMVWLIKENLLDEMKKKEPFQLTKDRKDHLLDLLMQSKGFGLEAVKGSLFRSIEVPDIDKLIKLRAVCYYSPNDFTKERVKTLGIMIRWLRKQIK